MRGRSIGTYSKRRENDSEIPDRGEKGVFESSLAQRREPVASLILHEVEKASYCVPAADAPLMVRLLFNMPVSTLIP